MTDTIISVQNVSKVYQVGRKQQERYVALRDVIAREALVFARNMMGFARGRFPPRREQATDDFWALRDVSFEVRRGEVLGIIGRNGAGKSTMLKLLSRITKPSQGRIELRGRVASLLEVGTGFHPELTGRENIYLNGAVLGMTRTEIRRQFDEIIDFAEIASFLDTPVKRYSSGMYVRLAFAVAAHLNPEILIVDEVLAVGDAAFQKKCLGKMDDIAHKQGRTVIFVSHDIAAVMRMAQNAVYLVNGQVAKTGPVVEVVGAYMTKSGASTVYESAFETPPGRPFIKRIEVMTSRGGGVQEFGEPMSIMIDIQYSEPVDSPYFAIFILNELHQPVIHAHAYPPDITFGDRGWGTTLRCEFPNIRLNVGKFSLNAILSGPPGFPSFDNLEGICHFEVVRTDRAIPWGWRPHICAYHEDVNWTVSSATTRPGSDLGRVTVEI